MQCAMEAVVCKRLNDTSLEIPFIFVSCTCDVGNDDVDSVAPQTRYNVTENLARAFSKNAQGNGRVGVNRRCQQVKRVLCGHITHINPRLNIIIYFEV